MRHAFIGVCSRFWWSQRPSWRFGEDRKALEVHLSSHKTGSFAITRYFSLSAWLCEVATQTRAPWYKTNNYKNQNRKWIAVPASLPDDGGRVIQVCSDQRLFVANTNFYHKKRHRFSWCLLSPSQRWAQSITLSIATDHRWCWSKRDCCLFWSTSVDSDHALFRANFCLHLVCGHISRKATCPVKLILNDNRGLQFQSKLLTWLSSQQNV